jgi:hypothetical protein
VASDERGHGASLLRIAIRAAGAGVGSLVITLPLRIADVLPEVAVIRIFAIVTLFAAVVYATRWEIHLEGILHQCEGRVHVCVIAVEGLVAFAFLAFGPFLLSDPDAWIETGGSAAFVVAIIVLAVWMSGLVERTAIKSGTTLAGHCWLINVFRTELLWRLDHVPVVRKIDGLFEREAPPGRVSYLILWIVVGLLTVCAANTPTTVPAAMHLLAGGTKTTPRTATGSADHRASHKSGRPSTVVSTTSSEEMRTTEDQESRESSSPEYYQLCGADPIPGSPAPAPVARALYGQWLGEGGLGAIVAGCAQDAEKLTSGAWYEVGRCEGALRSLAFANEGTSGIVLWAPARYAFAHAVDGSLAGVTSGQLVGTGQMYTVDTSDGTAVFIRSQLAQEASDPGEPPTACSEYHEGVIPLVEIRPGLARLWASFIEAEHEWLWPSTPSPKKPTRIIFKPSKERDHRRIIGMCKSETACQLSVEGAISPSRGTSQIDVDAVLEYAPPAP